MIALALALGCAGAQPACSSHSFQRETDTTGRFQATATSFRFLLFFEVPWNPRLRAIELARDSWGDNLRVVRSTSWPDLGILHWVNGLIIGWRSATVEGVYGIPPDTEEGRKAFEEAMRRRGERRNIDGSAITPTEGVDR